MKNHNKKNLPTPNKTPFRLRPLPASVALALSLSMGLAQAATINVDSTSDTAEGVCRLRDAIKAAQMNAAVQGCSAGFGADTISLLGIAGETITLNGTQLNTPSSNITIEGANVTVDANRESHLITSSGTVTIRDLSLVGGSVAGSGGAIQVTGGSFKLIDSTISGNTAATSGGAIQVTGGSFELIRSTISGNTAATNCGGIEIYSAQSARLANSTISDNTADNYGGGICFGSVLDGTLINSTVSGNTASIGNGGGVHLSNTTGQTVALISSTLTGNSAAVGGGLYRKNPGTVTLTNSIIANSLGGGDCFNNDASSPDALGVNLIEDGGSDCFTPDPSLLMGDPRLDSLSDNGGATLTHSLLAGSPAINAVAGECSVTHDQRRFERIDGMCDLGAFEVNGVPIQPGPDFEVNVVSDSDNGYCNVLPADCTLREAINAAEADPDASNISMRAIAGDTITLNGTELDTLSSTVTIEGAGVTVDANGLSRVIKSAGTVTISNLSLVGGSVAGSGGAMRVTGGSFELIGSTIDGNHADSDCGGIDVFRAQTVRLTNSTISGNNADNDGGGICFRNVMDGALINSTVSGNTASTGSGGGVHLSNLEQYFVALINSTLSGNSAVVGGGLYRKDIGPATITNTIIANSVGGGDCVNAGIYSPQALGINLVEDGGSDCFPAGPGLLTGDPLLGSLADNSGPTLTHSLLPGSEAINAVAGDCPVSHDQRGFARTDGMCDLGAFEIDGVPFQPGPDFVVNVAGDDDDGFCNPLPLPGDCTLREAINAADASLDASTITFALDLPARIALTSNTSLPTVTSDITIQAQSGITVDGDCREFQYQGLPCPIQPFTVALPAGRLAINDLTIRNGSAEVNGGAIAVLDSATLELTDSTVSTSRADLRGGAIYAGPGTQVTLTRSTLSGNGVCIELTDDRRYGNGIFAGAGSVLTIDSSRLLNNINARPYCISSGGGIFMDSGTAILTDVSVSDNRASQYGGGFGARNSNITINNSTLSGNSGGFGGGVHFDGGQATLTNSTLSGNEGEGGAVVVRHGGVADLFNSTLWGNTANVGAGLFSQAATITISNSIIANSIGSGDCFFAGNPISALGVNLVEGGGADCGLTPGPNLLTGDAGLLPLTDNGGITMTHSPMFDSQVLNAGDNAAIPAGVVFDQRGTGFPRILGSAVDLGALEYQINIFGNSFENTD